VEPLWIDEPAALAELVRTLSGEPLYGLDTEFHGERSYWPHLALIQIAWSGGVALVDPLATDPAPLGRLLAGPGHVTAMKTSVYGSGEAPPTFEAAPGYRPFFLIAFFFAVVHLGMLVLGTGGLPLPAAAYIVGLLLALAALILG
jgi:hypothetical protein